MSTSDSSTYLSAVRWGDEGYYLKEFTQKFRLPQVAKIIKGQYQNLGVPSLPSPSLNNVVLLASAGKRLKIAAQCVKFKDGRKPVTHGPKLAIPDTYEGWFEILSEDGRCVRCIDTVSELVKKFPEICLVRESIKAFVCKTDDPEAVTDKMKTIQVGETLVLVSEVVASPRGKASGRYLRCFTSRGETIYLSVDQRGKFSPIAGEENISGVHSVKTLISKRFPIMVRLVSGKPPVGLRNTSHFLPEMRLYSLFEEETIVALPLMKEQIAITLPPSAHLKVQAPKNVEGLVKLPEYTSLVEKCERIINELSDRIQLFDVPSSKDSRKEKSSNPYVYYRKHKNNHYNNHYIQRSISDPEGTNKPTNTERRSSSPGILYNREGLDSEDQRYVEIDQIYDYIRGFCPLPDKIKNEYPDEEFTTVVNSTSDVPDKPEPPPIETIPARKVSTSDSTISTQKITVSIINKASIEEGKQEHIYEKIRRKSDQDIVKNPFRSNSIGKIYVQKYQNNKTINNKNIAQHRFQQKSRLSKHNKGSAKDFPFQKQSRSNKTYKNNNNKSLTTSPLFNIRYKSLNNLALDFSTLESSNSGGQASSGGGGGVETNNQNTARKLPRPKSLTNLFWETDKQVEKCNKFNLLQNDISRGTENRKLIFTHEPFNAKLNSNVQNKRFGTLYL
ncbi:uncharacterized protein LOC111617818 [Centruroides sculpturatus]|uniref:uncharacterized protein LOC111617818 n=1 Tax=Centruroides sculpturatus TaxID=218467 RepID=UPI000C6D0BD1|nr:uncharacterized protein LOC111617818 [Centruroides sculpturatus]